MSGKIPTAREVLDLLEKDYEVLYTTERVEKLMVEFAKLHVQEALKYALEEVPYGCTDYIHYKDVVGILTCYPLENIQRRFYPF